MLTALILICSLSVTPDISSCNPTNAVVTMRVPDQFGSPATCFMHGQAYLAETSIGRDLADDERVRVICAHGTTTAAAH